jgi:YD repeat-containing protein
MVSMMEAYILQVSQIPASSLDMTLFRRGAHKIDKGANLMLVLLKILLTIASAAFMAASYGENPENQYDFNPPDVKLVDKVGVNLISGLAEFNQVPVSIGPTEAALSFRLRFDGQVENRGNWADGFYGGIFQSKYYWPSDPHYWWYDEMTVRMFSRSETFRLQAGVWVSGRQTGAKLIENGDGSFEYIGRDGVRYITNPNIRAQRWCKWGPPYPCMAITKVIFPSGKEISINYSGSGTSGLVRSVSQNNGYELRYSSLTDTVIEKVVAVNKSVDYCAPTATSCTYSRTWPQASLILTSNVVNWVGTEELVVTDAAGLSTTYSQGVDISGKRVISVKWPSSTSVENVSLEYIDKGYCVVNGAGHWDCNILRKRLVSSATIGLSKWTYSYDREVPQAPPYTDLDGLWNTVTVGPTGFTASAQHNVKSGITRYVNTSDGNLSYDLVEPNRVLSASDSEGRRYSFAYDSRGNVTEKRQVAESGSGLADAVHSAGYDTTCTCPAKCNKPNWIKDARGNQTDFTYDCSHGGLLKETLPADPQGIRPQSRYTYTQRYAWVKNSAGSFVKATAPIWMLASKSACIAGAAATSGSGCALGASDEVVTTYDYGPDSGPNNLLRRGQAVAAGGTTLRTCYGYDVLGNRISETTPNAGLTSCP